MKHPVTSLFGTALLYVLGALHSTLAIADAEEELAKRLANPVAALISVPFQFNYDANIGRADGHRSVLNIQPVVPFDLNANWNLISRTILPLIDQHDIAGRSGDQSGLGDLTQSLFFSPKMPTPDGMIWGAGPIFVLPTASDSLLGAEKWGLGPTGVVLVQKGSRTYGALANHVWSVAGDDTRSDVSSTLIQPFLSYVTQTHTTFSVNTESTYNWKTSKWSVPLNFGVSQLFKVGTQPMSLGLQARYWVESPESGPEGWGMRVSYTLIFPK